VTRRPTISKTEGQNLKPALSLIWNNASRSCHPSYLIGLCRFRYAGIYRVIRTTVVERGEETIIAKGCELLLDAFQLVSISSRNRVPNNGGVFKLRLN
jgi:hypothetical protein